MKIAAPRHGHLLSIGRVAEILDASEKTVRRRIKSGDLRAHRFGRQVRVSQEDLAAYVAMNRQ